MLNRYFYQIAAILSSSGMRFGVPLPPPVACTLALLCAICFFDLNFKSDQFFFTSFGDPCCPPPHLQPALQTAKPCTWFSGNATIKVLKQHPSTHLQLRTHDLDFGLIKKNSAHHYHVEHSGLDSISFI